MQIIHPYRAAIGVGVLAALISVYGGPVAPLALVLIALLAAWSLKNPAVGLLALLPLVFIVHPTPQALGWQEMGFAALVCVSGAAALWHRFSLLAGTTGRRFVAAGVAVAVFLGINVSTALAHGVPLADWIRGLIPFGFLLYAIPVFLFAAGNDSFIRAWKLAAFCTSVLFCWRVLQVYVGGQMWEPSYYLFESGKWIPLTEAQAVAAGDRAQAFALRVTQVLQQSTDVFIPLALTWGVWMAIWGSNRNWRLTGLALAVVSSAAIVVTYTRSMLLTALLVAGALMLAAFAQKKFLRAIVAGVALVASIGSTIAIFGLEAIYLNRIYQFNSQMAQSMDAVQDKIERMQGRLPAKRAEKPKDVNITTRIEEYRIAWSMFTDSPVVGQGLGVKHAMRFETGNGDVLEQKVAYVHNWVMYMLMTGGLLGFLAYSLLIFGPAGVALRNSRVHPHLLVVAASIACLSLYALFFAVFRLIPFNLVLGGLWGLVLATAYKERKECAA